mgnify:CR=1 FL=1
MIGLIVMAVLAAVIGALVALGLGLGWAAGTLIWLGAATAALGLYRWVIRPWHLRWGATDQEVVRPMPGDEILPTASSATRAIAIRAPVESVWPWLVQIGFGRAGWYSYDWIDNDFKPSADRILPEHQALAPGDTILMAPDMGLEVVSVREPESIVSILGDGSTSWSLALYPDGDSCRLVSRWRPRSPQNTAERVLRVLVEPGTFIMEQKMLRTIRSRAETTP